MMPTDNGAWEKPQRTQKDNKLQTTERGGIDNVVLLAPPPQCLQRIKGDAPTLCTINGVMINDMMTLPLQRTGAIEQMGRQQTLLPTVVHRLSIDRMIIVDAHVWNDG